MTAIEGKMEWADNVVEVLLAHSPAMSESRRGNTNTSFYDTDWKN
jgi:hypothetical protein